MAPGVSGVRMAPVVVPHRARVDGRFCPTAVTPRERRGPQLLQLGGLSGGQRCGPAVSSSASGGGIAASALCQDTVAPPGLPILPPPPSWLLNRAVPEGQGGESVPSLANHPVILFSQI